jgi:DNA-directed RNA polymerase specialized sigma subunit
MDTTKLTAKEFLNQAYRIDQRINSKLEQVQSLRDLAARATATLSDMPRIPNPSHHRMEDFIDKAMDLESEINADLCRLIDIKREIVTVVKCVENRELQTLLEMRYLCFKTWEEIAAEMHFDLRWVYRLHGRALEDVDAIRHH